MLNIENLQLKMFFFFFFIKIEVSERQTGTQADSYVVKMERKEELSVICLEVGKETT